MQDYRKLPEGRDFWTKTWESFDRQDRRKINFSQVPVRLSEDGKLEPIPYQDH